MTYDKTRLIISIQQNLVTLNMMQSYRRKRQIEAARQGSTNSTSKIDSAARILFPLSFGLFNFAYWYSYLSSHKAFTWDDHVLKGRVWLLSRQCTGISKKMF